MNGCFFAGPTRFVYQSQQQKRIVEYDVAWRVQSPFGRRVSPSWRGSLIFSKNFAITFGFGSIPAAAAVAGDKTIFDSPVKTITLSQEFYERARPRAAKGSWCLVLRLVE
jgi:hypothetical protein